MEIVAVPTASGIFCPHFGGADRFVLCWVDQEHKNISDTESLAAPAHKPGALPRWLGEHGVTAVLAGRMGERAQKMLSRLHIDVVGGVSGADPLTMVRAYLDGTLESGDGQCDGTGHGRGHRHQCGGGHGPGGK